jgi:hypothetical protein
MFYLMVRKMFVNKNIKMYSGISHWLASQGAALESAVVQGVAGPEYMDLL